MNVAMLEDNVLLYLSATQTKKGSLYIPDPAQDAPQTATVIALGPGRWNSRIMQRDPIFVLENDLVLFPKYAGMSVEIDGNSYIIVKAPELLAVLRPAPASQPETPVT